MPIKQCHLEADGGSHDDVAAVLCTWSPLEDLGILELVQHHNRSMPSSLLEPGKEPLVILSIVLRTEPELQLHEVVGGEDAIRALDKPSCCQGHVGLKVGSSTGVLLGQDAAVTRQGVLGHLALEVQAALDLLEALHFCKVQPLEIIERLASLPVSTPSVRAHCVGQGEIHARMS